nr:DNA polymerase III subunit alpha [Chitinophagales bacterium]
CCIAGIVPQTILHQGIEAGEKELIKWQKIFGEDYYVELQRHNISIEGTDYTQESLNQVLIQLARKHQIKLIATNDSHYVDQEDAKVHEILLCINTNSKLSDPRKYSDDESIVLEGNKPIRQRFSFPNDQFYFKTSEEMAKLFEDLPEVIDNSLEISEKIGLIKLEKKVEMPKFEIPNEYKNQAHYLTELVYQGAYKRYGKSLNPEVKERLDFELDTIINSEFEGYFLIIDDFMRETQKNGVGFGPGRGSVGGSLIAYCLGITQVDPIEYDLLFERFLNPERVTLPDVDIDIEDCKRDQVLQYVVDKYDANNVSQIVTYGKLKAKSAIKDVCRVMSMEPSFVNTFTKNIPNNVELEDLTDEKKLQEIKKTLTAKDLIKVKAFEEMYLAHEELREAVAVAKKLNNYTKNTGVHACGVIISPNNLESMVPLASSKASDMMITQYDKDAVEQIGLLKMDFLGLKNITIIKECVALVAKNYGVEIDIEHLDLKNQKTYELFQSGNTDGIFQFESDGMKQTLRTLCPDKITDLIATTALYRPGPMAYIPSFINRKKGKEPITYLVPETAEILEETYGILVYQEQVMRISQKIAGFSKGKADELRKAMGKKKEKDMAKLKELYLEGIRKNNLDEEKCEELWENMANFAKYAFNKSHAACYAMLSFQCGYLKANYYPEFMAAMISNNMDSIDDVKKYLNSVRRDGYQVLGPNVNFSYTNFTVENKQAIRFGLNAIKGIGTQISDTIWQERQKNGPFNSFADFVKRIPSQSLTKAVIETLALAGAFDDFSDLARANFIPEQKEDEEQLSKFLNSIVKFNQNYNQKTEQTSLFGNELDLIAFPKIPKPFAAKEINILNAEKKVIGLYLSTHPLDEYAKYIHDFCEDDLKNMDLDKYYRDKKSFYIAGIIEAVNEYTNEKTNRKYTLVKCANFHTTNDIRLNESEMIKYSYFIKKDSFILVKMKPSPNNKVPGEYFSNVEEILPLDQIKTMPTALRVYLDINAINDSFTEKITELITKHQGNNLFLEIELHDEYLNFIEQWKQVYHSSSEEISESDEVESNDELISDTIQDEFDTEDIETDEDDLENPKTTESAKISKLKYDFNSILQASSRIKVKASDTLIKDLNEFVGEKNYRFI